jgi:hypothetical protein
MNHPKHDGPCLTAKRRVFPAYTPENKDFSKMHGKTGKNSIWNNHPIPTVEQYDGVAYVSPISIVKHLFVNGVPIDDMLFIFLRVQVPLTWMQTMMGTI